MTIQFARITTEMGPFAFVKLPESLDPENCDVREWACRLSATVFRGIGVAVCSFDGCGNRVIRGSEPKWERQADQIQWKGMGLNSMSVEDPPLRQKGREKVER